MIRIELVYDERYSCIDNTFFMLMNYLEKDIIYKFAENWAFTYNKKASCKTIGEKIDSARGNSYYFLKKYQGIDFKEEYNKDIAINKIISNLSNGKPIVYNFDMYFCPWSKLYKVSHLTHYCLIIDYDSIAQKFLCADSLLSKKKYRQLDLNDFYNGFKKIVCYNVNKVNDNMLNIDAILDFSLKRIDKLNYENGNMFLQIKEFGKDILSININNEIGIFEDDLTYSPLVLQMSRIRLARINYLRFLRKIIFTKENDKMIDIIKNYESIIDKWTKICNLLIKILLTKNEVGLKRLSEEIVSVAELEKITYQQLLQYCKHKRIDT